MTIQNQHADFIAPSEYSLEELRAVLFQADYTTPSKLDDLTALSLLLTFRYEGKFEDLQRLLADRERDSRLRHGAAVGLASFNRDQAEAALTQALAIEDPIVLRGVVKGLGYIGSDRSLPTLQRFARQYGGSLQQTAQWAATLIAYREDSNDEFRLTLPRDLIAPEGDRTRAVETRQATAELLRQVAADIRQDPLNIDLAAEVGWEISCLNNTYLLLLSPAVVAEPNSLTQRKLIAGALLSLAAIEEDRWYPRYYILTHPNTQREGALFLAAGTGKVHYAGTFLQKEKQVEFQLRATSLPGGRPLQIEGILAPQTFRIVNAVIAADFFRRNRPVAGKLPG